MLSAEALATLAVGQPALPVCDDDGVSMPGVSPPSSIDSTTSETVSVAVARDPSGHAEATTKGLDYTEKWVDGLLRKLSRTQGDLLLPDLQPNNALASEMHELAAKWVTDGVRACDVGVVYVQPSLRVSTPPTRLLTLLRAWMRRHINIERAKPPHRLPNLPTKWGEDLAGRKADTLMVKKVTREKRAASGHMYHSRHDLAPSNDQFDDMMMAGWIGDKRVHADPYSVVSAGAAVAIFLPTGARGQELKTMPLQVMGHEAIEQEKSGHIFACLKLTAFHTKTKEHHLNQFLPHSNPIRCGVGLFGFTLLLRVRIKGPPPFTMGKDANSWSILGTDIDNLDRRIQYLFDVAGLRRQTGDVLTCAVAVVTSSQHICPFLAHGIYDGPRIHSQVPRPPLWHPQAAAQRRLRRGRRRAARPLRRIRTIRLRRVPASRHVASRRQLCRRAVHAGAPE